MVTKLVIDESELKKEVIEKLVEEYKEKNNITDIVVYPKEEYDKKKKWELAENSLVVMTESDYEEEKKMELEAALSIMKMPEIPPIRFERFSNCELYQGRTEKDKKQQDKWRRKFYKK